MNDAGIMSRVLRAITIIVSAVTWARAVNEQDQGTRQERKMKQERKMNFTCSGQTNLDFLRACKLGKNDCAVS